MRSTPRHLLLLALAAGIAAARGGEPAILAKARAYLGPEQALDSVRSIHLSGTVVGDDMNDPKAPQWTARVDFIFQKPWQESLLIRYQHQIVHTALDDFEAWQQVQDHTEEGQAAIDNRRDSTLIVFRAPQVKNLRADTWYNLNFYRGLEEAGATVKDEGPATIDGVACEKVVFTHSPAIVYTRYFDRATGRLVFTQTRAGSRIRESGEILAGGIRFPRTIVSSETTPSGRVVKSTYTFERVTLNETFPESLFEVPLLPVSDDTAPAFPTAGSH